ncbi:MAG: CDP-glycerol glycerophosphotransferase family protein [Ignavibacteriae bacterium]|nr:CDP-glycerol glycerophosphotransferase family protein [Ignavibacteriota bacterium]
MVFSEILLKIPYTIAWYLTNSRINPFPIVFYCTDFIDYEIFEPILNEFEEITIVSKNRNVQEKLFEHGVSSILWPVYPKVVFMARHSLHMFPAKKIIKIGMRHGAYNFKSFISKKKYNKFDLYFFTSQNELNEAKEIGITIGDVGGFPKIDVLHNGQISFDELENLKVKLKFNNGKPIILFSATWNKSELSAITKWYDKLRLLTNDYNILVTAHSFTEKNIIEKIKSEDNIYFIENEKAAPYLLLADILIGDSSSIIAEFCTLDKPIITFRIEEKGRLNLKIINMLDEISFRVNSFEELINILPNSLKNKNLLSEKRKHHSKIMIDNFNGNATKIMSEKIKLFLAKKGISIK